jgi:hypothetical protein
MEIYATVTDTQFEITFKRFSTPVVQITQEEMDALKTSEGYPEGILESIQFIMSKREGGSHETYRVFLCVNEEGV